MAYALITMEYKSCSVHGHHSFSKLTLFIMDLSVEAQFRNELYNKYAALKKVLIPKDEYYSTIEELKAESCWQCIKK